MTQLDERVVQIAEKQHGAFSTSQISKATRSQIRTRTSTTRWRRIHKNVFIIAGSSDTWERRLWIALLTAGDGAVVGLRSAAALHGIRGFGPGPIDIVQPEESVPKRKSRGSRRTTRLPARHITEVRGFPVTTPERTLFDLAGITSWKRRHRGLRYQTRAQVERAVEHALSQKIVTLGSLTTMHRNLAGRGRAGTCVMREFLEARDETYVATDSDLEDVFVALIDKYSLPKPARQVHLGSEDRRIGRVDFYFDDARLVVEADSQAFHGQRTQMIRDHKRDMELLAAGWQVLRVDWWQLTEEPLEVARLLRRILCQRAEVRTRGDAGAPDSPK